MRRSVHCATFGDMDRLKGPWPGVSNHWNGIRTGLEWNDTE